MEGRTAKRQQLYDNFTLIQLKLKYKRNVNEIQSYETGYNINRCNLPSYLKTISRNESVFKLCTVVVLFVSRVILLRKSKGQYEKKNNMQLIVFERE